MTGFSHKTDRLPRPVRFLITLIIGALGGAVAHAAGLPAGWLLGSMLATLAAVLAGFQVVMPNRLRDLTFFILGVQAGSGVTPAVIGQLAIWPLSFAIQMIGVVFVCLATMFFLERVFKWDRETALFSSLPGALSFVLAAASETRADMTRITVLQTVRLFFLIACLVPLLGWLEGGDVVAEGRGAAPGGPFDYPLMIAVCAVLSWLGVLSRVPGGLILGALIGSAVLHGANIVSAGVPDVVAVPALISIGALIGSRLRREDRSVLPQLLPASVGAFAIGISVSALSGIVAIWALGLDIGRVSLAYAPGALEALTVLAYQFDIDPAYVAAHHVVRFVGIALLVPFLARRLPRRPSTLSDAARAEGALPAAARDTEASGQDEDGQGGGHRG
ncbi:AbrB family transcriptional regulator [Aureimonas frigidaquae]|uniref:AbrB family transcriptional regulator n=1 Tax=Aureimonas frigidaquae TaxID=424757 RepID=UPI000A584958|nr:AbrB family transcriptional regulator [Aureimonas frigidaquae]